MNPEPTKTPSQLLQEGRRRLIEEGWCQQYLVKFAGGRRSYCAVGAAMEGLPRPQSQVSGDRAWKVAANALAEALPPGPWPSIAHFNDDPDTTLADVLALYDRALTELTK